MSNVLRVLTLNTWNREGVYATRARLIRRDLAALAPDVLGFQEVLEDQVPELLAGLGYTHVWHAHGESGMAIAARWPIEQADALDLPAAHDATGNPAGPPVGGIVQRAIVRAPFAAIPFVNTTTYYPMPQDGWKREPQMPVLHDAVRGLQRNAGGRNAFPAVLVGDFNTEPESAEIRFLKGLQSIAGRSAYYCDAWTRAGDGSDGATWTRRNPASAAWGLPDRRIDFVFIAAPGVQGAGAVRQCRVVCDAPEGDTWPSDHLGVLAELGLPD
jgi:endonuclease/exonuclease/phosphatase family metal-dependent hydrolase